MKDYAVLQRQLEVQQAMFPGGLGCLVVIPAGAQRIQNDVRAEIERVLNAISVRCLCWAVLEEGFRGATIRATLTALSLVVQRRNYPTHVAGQLESALQWLLPHLDRGQARLQDMSEALGVFNARLSHE